MRLDCSHHVICSGFQLLGQTWLLTAPGRAEEVITLPTLREQGLSARKCLHGSAPTPQLQSLDPFPGPQYQSVEWSRIRSGHSINSQNRSPVPSAFWLALKSAPSEVPARSPCLPAARACGQQNWPRRLPPGGPGSLPARSRRRPAPAHLASQPRLPHLPEVPPGANADLRTVVRRKRRAHALCLAQCLE
ncbi:uncharacterized protein [Manis javanica]|uniref:uncharacterized protein isoform X2 n=1 Tax=Manis javanica TaxID=9974 RepID=UPI00187941D5|nr:uncharacterized protein LOC108405892 isoform X2 [Manis javanica]